MRLPLSLYGHKNIIEIGLEEIRAIISLLKTQGIKQVTQYKKLSVLKAFLNWSAEKGFSQSLRFPKMEKGHYEKFIPPTPNELHLMLSVAPQHIQRVIILGSQCGIRIGSSELFKLTWDDVDFELDIIRVHAAHKNPSTPWREIPIRKSLKAVLLEWKEQDRARGTVNVINFYDKPVASIKRAWAKMLRKAGISRRIRPYDLRHSFATELIAQGVDIGTIAKLMGHSSPNMIYQHYQFVMDKQKKAAVEALPDLAYVPKNMCPNEKGIMLNT